MSPMLASLFCFALPLIKVVAGLLRAQPVKGRGLPLLAAAAAGGSPLPSCAADSATDGRKAAAAFTAAICVCNRPERRAEVAVPLVVGRGLRAILLRVVPILLRAVGVVPLQRAHIAPTGKKRRGGGGACQPKAHAALGHSKFGCRRNSRLERALRGTIESGAGELFLKFDWAHRRRLCAARVPNWPSESLHCPKTQRANRPEIYPPPHLLFTRKLAAWRGLWGRWRVPKSVEPSGTAPPPHNPHIIRDLEEGALLVRSHRPSFFFLFLSKCELEN